MTQTIRAKKNRLFSVLMQLLLGTTAVLFFYRANMCNTNRCESTVFTIGLLLIPVFIYLLYKDGFFAIETLKADVHKRAILIQALAYLSAYGASNMTIMPFLSTTVITVSICVIIYSFFIIWAND